ncbi:lipoprotein-releasing ABC transporter permease subunit LolE [Psychromonas sp. Urea-02u-13]|uniref:lipoprotein-releasing ABC transporter permease subunit LolE n=1 Tax=Psychromonas sp. Urea-02u-13 TaxID=2058326 RepID=UPI000C34BEAC|nr:lipoprotein-releasing ABC transporter permease subunit LolE [Psychromonas sp. Urea-02u-13]PKG38902.1 lipoprotein-releasing system transmembrane subunit LolE [Psychromonas sp. Urea-02u-13]
MFRPLSLFIGLRYSRAKHKNSFVSFISIASILGISLGVMVLIVGLSTMNGFEKALRDQLLSVIPHAELEMVKGTFNDIEGSLAKVKANPQVLGATPYIALSGLLQKDTKMKALQIRAIAPETEDQVTDIGQYIKQGGWALLQPGERQIILGKNVATQLGVSVGQSLKLLLPQPSKGNKLKAPRVVSLKLAGLFEMGGQVDSTLGFMHIEDAQEILNLSSANAIAFKVDDILDAQRIAREVGYSLTDYLYIKSWITSQGYLYQDIQMVKSLMYVILLLVVAVACFNIVSTLVMAVNEKRSDIAILKTMGASNWSLRFIFIVQGAFNGLVGSLIGAIAGCYVALNLTAMIKLLEGLIGHKVLSGDIYFIDFLPSDLDYQQALVVTLSAFIMSVLATIYPAWRASTIQPAQELGYSH